MKASFEKIRQMHGWSRWYMSIGGCWPLEPSKIKFNIGFIYFTLHMILGCNDLVHVFGDMNQVIENLADTTMLQILIGGDMLVLRHSAKLVKIVKLVEDGANEEHYRSEKEKELYFEYTMIGRRFFQVFASLTLVSELTYVLGPFDGIIKSVIHNETLPYRLPFRILLPFDVNDTRTYAIVYAIQAPMFYYYYLHPITICFLCTLIVHVAAEMSILAHQIRNINDVDTSGDSSYIDSIFRNITIRHIQIIEHAETIDGIFNIILMQELLVTTVLIGLTAYNVLVMEVMASVFEFVIFVIFTISMVGVIFIYCIIGEFLMRESMNVADAYYECQWYTMPPRYKNHMVISMIRAQKYMQLTAGGFYVFTLSRFSNILKTSMAYISMLRTVV